MTLPPRALPSPAVLTIAEPLVAAGLHVFLCRGKMPAVAGGHGWKDATTSLEALATVASEHPDACNLGIQPGRSGLVVVDLDEMKAPESIPALLRLQALAEERGGLPDTLTVRTGSGGRHLYFRAHPTHELGQRNGVPNPSTGLTESGVDYRGTKGYVIAPGSIHPTTGKPYRWASGCYDSARVADLPDWLVEFLDPPRPVPERPSGWSPPVPEGLDARRVAGLVRVACERLSRLGVGMSRRTELQRAAYRLAGWLWTGYPRSDLRRALLDAAATCGHLDRDTERTIDMALTDGESSPLPLPPDTAAPSPRPRGTEGPMAPAAPLEVYDDAQDTAACGAERLRTLADAVPIGPALASVYEDPDALREIAVAFRMRRDAFRAFVARVRPGNAAIVDEFQERVAERAAELGRGEQDEPAPPPPPVRDADAPVIVKPVGGSAYYLQIDDDWALVDGEHLHTEFTRAHPGLPAFVPKAKGDGERPMSTKELVAYYGRRTDRVVYDMSSPSGFRRGPRGGGEYVMRCCRPDSRLVAVFDDQVNEWLDRLGAERADRLRDWLSQCMRLDRAIAALYVRGKRGCGKGMLAAALSRIYGNSRSTYKQVVMGNWTAALVECPIVHLDERAPQDRNHNGSADFRSLIGESERPLTRKYLTDSTIRGCPRLVITANNEDALRFSEEDLSLEDEEAIAQRIVYVHAPDECSEWLAELGRDGTSDWVEMPDGSPGRIARHVAWLAENWAVQRPGRRFLVEGDSSEWFKKLAVRAGLAQEILIALAKCAAGADREWRGDASPTDWSEATVDGTVGWVFVRVSQLQARWKELLNADRAPSHRALGSALKKMAGEKLRPGSGVERKCGYRVPLSLVLEVADDLEVADPEDIRTRLGLPA